MKINLRTALLAVAANAALITGALAVKHHVAHAQADKVARRAIAEETLQFRQTMLDDIADIQVANADRQKAIEDRDAIAKEMDNGTDLQAATLKDIVDAHLRNIDLQDKLETEVNRVIEFQQATKDANNKLLACTKAHPTTVTAPIPPKKPKPKKRADTDLPTRKGPKLPLDLNPLDLNPPIPPEVPSETPTTGLTFKFW